MQGKLYGLFILFKLFLLPFKMLFLIGEPVCIAFFPYFNAVSLKLHSSAFDFFAIILFARPIVISLSCVRTGIFNLLPAIQTGSDTNPPLENIMSGLIFLIKFFAFLILDINLKGICKFLYVKDLISFTVGISR